MIGNYGKISLKPNTFQFPSKCSTRKKTLKLYMKVSFTRREMYCNLKCNASSIPKLAKYSLGNCRTQHHHTSMSIYIDFFNVVAETNVTVYKFCTLITQYWILIWLINLAHHEMKALISKCRLGNWDSANTGTDGVLCNAIGWLINIENQSFEIKWN